MGTQFLSFSLTLSLFHSLSLSPSLLLLNAICVFQDVGGIPEEADKETNGHSSDDYTLSPSDEEGNTLDSLPPKPAGPESAKGATEPAVQPTPPDGETQPCPVPKPRSSRQNTPNHQPSPPPTLKPRTVLLFKPSEPNKQPPATPPPRADPEEEAAAAADLRPKQSLRKLRLTDEEKSQLVNLQSLSVDSDSETPGGSSSCSSSSATAGGPGPPKPEGLDGPEEEGYWSGSTAGHVRDQRNRRCFRRKELPSGQTRVRSKFSPWNLSSPRISRDGRLSVHVGGRAGESFV